MMSSEEEQMDRISDLPEPLLLQILSLLPVRLAARTSLLSRQFRHLWKASPDLDIKLDLRKDDHNFINMAECALIRRDPSCCLHRLRLDVSYKEDITASYLLSLLLKAKSLRLQHLWINLFVYDLFDIFPFLLSVKTLESLVIDCWLRNNDFILPSTTSLPLLKSLDLKLYQINSEKLNGFISELSLLKELSLEIWGFRRLNLTSQTVTKLKLTVENDDARAMMVSMPNLESLHFENMCNLSHFSGEMPKLRKASIILGEVCRDYIGGTFDLFTLMNVEELKLDLIWRPSVGHLNPFVNPYHRLVEPGEVLPMFYNLKSIHLSCCFHEKNMKDVASLVRNSPALESLEMVHKGSNMFYLGLWKPMLPRNHEGNNNNQHVNFTDLHITDKKNELVKWLTENRTSKGKY